MLASVRSVNPLLREKHYLGPTVAGFAWRDEYGAAVFAEPRGRHIQAGWLELVRWCLRGEPGDGSRQWARLQRWFRAHRRDVTTVVSYSDPAQGHTGSLYRACGWLWAPTWHRLFPPPTGNGSWKDGEPQAVKDRWVFPLQRDEARAESLSVKDGRVARMPWAEYREPRWRRGSFDPRTGGGDWKRFSEGRTP